jgi:GWxTD domain-containing protein
LYNADTILGNRKNFLYLYYLETADKMQKLNAFGSFKKQVSSAVNPLLAKLDITKLTSGNYNLVVEAKDENNIIHLQKKYFFQRLNTQKTDATTSDSIKQSKELENYFGACNNTDTLQMFVECLWPIANQIDKERIINQAVKKDSDLMKKFAVDFWQRRAADTANPLKMWSNYYKSVQEVMALFKCGKQKGYYTERGRVYLQYGKPNQRAQQFAEANTFPYEIWQYYRLTDGATGQFFSNRKFVFVNKQLADECYNLVHSDMRGEIKNERWQFEVTRRNSNGLANPDNVTPIGTENNQFKEIFNSPR